MLSQWSSEIQVCAVMILLSPGFAAGDVLRIGESETHRTGANCHWPWVHISLGFVSIPEDRDHL